MWRGIPKMIFSNKHKSNSSELSDKDLVNNILHATDKKLQRQLQEDLYGRYIQKVYFRCVGIVKDKNIAQDLAHDIMVKMFLNLSKYLGKAPFGSWVFSITYNHCINHLRKEKKLKLDDLDALKDQIPNDNKASEEKQLLELQLTRLEEIFEKLKEDEKLILLMRYQDGMSIKMIAGNLKISESATKMRLKRSRDHLAKFLKEVN